MGDQSIYCCTWHSLRPATAAPQVRLICKEPLIPLYAGVGFEMVGPSDVVRGLQGRPGARHSCALVFVVHAHLPDMGRAAVCVPFHCRCLAPEFVVQVHGQNPWFEMKWAPGVQEEEEEGGSAAGGAGQQQQDREV